MVGPLFAAKARGGPTAPTHGRQRARAVPCGDLGSAATKGRHRGRRWAMSPKANSRAFRRPVTVRWARFGPSNRQWFMHVPRGGVCLSAFLIVRNRQGDVLLGRPRHHAAWAEKGCLPAFRVREIVRRAEWILPASHLLVEESPSHAAKRISRDWAGLRGTNPRLIALDSSRVPSGQFTGSGPNRRRIYHWALGFVYEVRSNSPPTPAPWWTEMKFVPMGKMSTTRVGRGHRDIIRYLGGRESPPQ